MKYTVNKNQSTQILTYCQQTRILSLHGFIFFLPNSIAFSQICLSLFALTYIVEAVSTKRAEYPKTPLTRPIIAYIAITLLTTMFAINISSSIHGLKSVLSIGVFYVVYLAIRDLSHLKKITGLLLLYVTIAAGYGIVQHYLEVDVFRLSKPISLLKHVNNDLTAPVRIPGFSSYMTFSGQLAMIIPIIFACIPGCRHYIKKGLLTSALLLTCLALLWTYTRSAWLGAICAVACIGYLKNKKYLIGLLVCLLLIAGSAYIFQPELAGRIRSTFCAKENLERIYTWESTLSMIKDYPLTGIGKGNYSKTADSYREPYGDFEFTSRAHAHNSLLQVAVEGGIPSALCFIWLWGVLFFTLYQTYQHMPEHDPAIRYLALGFFGSAIAFFVQGFFENNFGDSETVMMMWCIIALALKLRELTTLHVSGPQ